MGTSKIKIAVLTSSRADYSIYYHLLKKLYTDNTFDLSIIAYGTHLSPKHGYTINEILKDNFTVKYKIKTYPENDTPSDINKSMSTVIKKLDKIWGKNTFDYVIALGDRYEMFAAVSSILPYNYKICHIHGGEETKGAIDNAYRHSITMMADYHFASAEEYKQRIIQMRNSSENVYNVGALSIENLTRLKLLTQKQLSDLYNINFYKPYVLVTFHPETINYKKNIEHIRELISTLNELTKYNIIITMPNADTNSDYIRKELTIFGNSHKNIHLFENMGTVNYLSCMKYCEFMLGNTSSGFIEASFFPKKVINIGTRQSGRIVTPNIINCDIKKENILESIKLLNKLKMPQKIDIYGNGKTSDKIIKILKNQLK